VEESIPLGVTQLRSVVDCKRRFERAHCMDLHSETSKILTVCVSQRLFFRFILKILWIHITGTPPQNSQPKGAGLSAQCTNLTQLLPVTAYKCFGHEVA
jgi:hypothetical protein